MPRRSSRILDRQNIGGRRRDIRSVNRVRRRSAINEARRRNTALVGVRAFRHATNNQAAARAAHNMFLRYGPGVHDDGTLAEVYARQRAITEIRRLYDMRHRLGNANLLNMPAGTISMNPSRLELLMASRNRYQPDYLQGIHAAAA